jgi:hypothetical protein
MTAKERGYVSMQIDEEREVKIKTTGGECSLVLPLDAVHRLREEFCRWINDPNEAKFFRYAAADKEYVIRFEVVSYLIISHRPSVQTDAGRG